MLVQQISMVQCQEQRQTVAAPVINKIDHQASKFRNLITHLRLSKKKSSAESAFTPFQLQNESQISNIEPVSEKLDKNSFQLDLHTDLTNKRNTFTVVPVHNKQKYSNKQGLDKGLKYRPRGAVNGRDDIRVHNLSQIHKKIIGQVENHKNHNSPKQKSNINLESTFKKLQQYQYQNPQSYPNQSRYLSSKSRFKISSPKTKNTSNLTSPSARRKNIEQQQQNQRITNFDSFNKKKIQNQNVVKIQAKQLSEYLKKQRTNQFPNQNSSPNKIYQFFINICSNFNIQNQFSQPLIKRYRNCIYFGQKITKDQSYIGLVWYYRKAIYYGQFLKGRKNGYGIQIDLQDQDNVCIWRGTFSSGKKTGYFQLISSSVQYNGSLVNSYFDGEGMLKIKGYSIYKGGFQAGMKHGFGVQNFENKKSLSYKGQYAENKFQGKGVLQGPNYYYKGQFRNNKPHGNGFQRTDQFQYEGQFKDGKKSGRGILKIKNGQKFQGIFENGYLTKQITFGANNNNNSKINFKTTQKILQNQQTAPVITQYTKSIKIQSFKKTQQQTSLTPSSILQQETLMKPPSTSKSIPFKPQQPYTFQKYNNNLNSKKSLDDVLTNNYQKSASRQKSRISNTISNININTYSSRIIPLDKHLSKRLNSLYEQNQNQQGTIDPSLNINTNISSMNQKNNINKIINNNNFGIFKMHRIQDEGNLNRNFNNLKDHQNTNRNSQHVPFNSQISRICKNQKLGNNYSDSQEDPLDIKVLPKD